MHRNSIVVFVLLLTGSTVMGPSTLLRASQSAPGPRSTPTTAEIPVPAPHSPEWAPDREPTLKAAVRAEVTALLDLLRPE